MSRRRNRQRRTYFSDELGNAQLEQHHAALIVQQDARIRAAILTQGCIVCGRNARGGRSGVPGNP
jgi:hypothetical protein